MYKLSIPKPCFQQWDEMTPSTGGRYCSFCTKTVVDFSGMSDTEVQNYFIRNNGIAVCGHFKVAQLERIRIDLPRNIFRIKFPYWKRFLVVLLIVFGSSFLGIDTCIAGSPLPADISSMISKAKTSEAKKTPHFFDRKKKKARRKKRIKTCSIISGKIDLTTLTTSGYTVIDRSDRVHDPRDLPKEDTNNRIEETTEEGDNNDKPVPEPQSPPFPAEYILPPVLALADPFGKQKD